MTPEQIATFRTALLSETDQELVGYRNNGQTPLIYAWYNQTASPDFWVWRTQVSLDEIMQNGFDWVRVDNLSLGKARIWEWLFKNQSTSINPSKANVRAGISECWKGTTADVAVRDAVLVHCRRQCSRVERLFVTGSGTTSAPSDAVNLSFNEVDVSVVLNS